MLVSTKGRYALRTMVDLAVHGDGEPVKIKDHGPPCGGLLSDRGGACGLRESGGLAHFYRQWNHRFHERISVSGGDGGGGDAGSEGKVQPGQRLKFLYIILTHGGDPGDGRILILICRVKGCHRL